MKTIKTWFEASNLLENKDFLNDFSVNLKLSGITIKARSKKLILRENYIRGFLGSVHNGILIDDKNSNPTKIALPNGTEFIYYKNSDKITVNYYKRSDSIFFIGLFDKLSNEFWHECEVHNLKPKIKKKSLSYLPFNENTNEYIWLSNKSNHSIKLKFITYENVDSALKSMKNNPFLKVNSFPRPKEIRIYMPLPLTLPFTMSGSGSSVYSGVSREHLNSTVKSILNKKLKQHPELVKLLIETKDMVLFYDISNKPKPTSSDYYWGAELQNNELLGYNHLGKIWMEIRNRIKKSNQ